MSKATEYVSKESSIHAEQPAVIVYQSGFCERHQARPLDHRHLRRVVMLHDLRGKFSPGDTVYLRCSVVGYSSDFAPLGTVALRAVDRRGDAINKTVWYYGQDAALVDPRAIEGELKERGYDAGWKDCLEAIRNGNDHSGLPKLPQDVHGAVEKTD